MGFCSFDDPIFRGSADPPGFPLRAIETAASEMPKSLASPLEVIDIKSPLSEIIIYREVNLVNNFLKIAKLFLDIQQRIYYNYL